MMQSAHLIRTLPVELLDELAVCGAGTGSTVTDEVLAGSIAAGSAQAPKPTSCHHAWLTICH